MTSSENESVYTYIDDFNIDGYDGKLSVTKMADKVILKKFANNELVWEVTVRDVKAFCEEFKFLYGV